VYWVLSAVGGYSCNCSLSRIIDEIDLNSDGSDIYKMISLLGSLKQLLELEICSAILIK